jgi:hypothetical protein
MSAAAPSSSAGKGGAEIAGLPAVSEIDPFTRQASDPSVTQVPTVPENIAFFEGGALRQDAPEIDDERADEVEPPEVCTAVETSENSEDEGTDEENLQQVATNSVQETGDIIREDSFETVDDEGSPRSRSSSDWSLVDIAEPEHREEQDTSDLVDIPVPEHREEQDKEECETPHSTVESEKQALPAVSKDSWYLNRSSNDTWDLMGAAGLPFSETPDKEDHGPPSRRMESGEQPMADSQCIKKVMRNHPGGKHSLDTGGTGECMAEGADTGGVESCGQDVNLGSQVESNPANLGFWEYADQTQVDSSPADVIAALSADHIADADDHVPLEHEPCWKVVQHSTDFCQSNVMSPPFASALPYLPPFADSNFQACILDSRRQVQEDHKGRAKIIL